MKDGISQQSRIYLRYLLMIWFLCLTRYIENLLILTQFSLAPFYQLKRVGVQRIVVIAPNLLFTQQKLSDYFVLSETHDFVLRRIRDDFVLRRVHKPGVSITDAHEIKAEALLQVHLRILSTNLFQKVSDHEYEVALRHERYLLLDALEQRVHLFRCLRIEAW